MRAKTIQIVWHGKEPVYSVDFHPDGTLFTGGADKEIKAWEVSRGDDGYAAVSHVSTLAGHSKTVNCMRFSPSGSHLVSSGDGGEMLLWQPSDPVVRGGNLCSEDAAAAWRRTALLRGHTDDVMDISWAADGSALLSGSIDNKAIVWEVSEKKRGQMVATFANHKHFVQGVAWDPAQQFVVTQSADRTCRVYALRPLPAGRRNKVSQYMLPACDRARDFYCAHTLSKRVVPPAATPATAGQGSADAAAPPAAKPERLPLFQDEAVPSFFRRLSWSPDGSFLVATAGTHRPAGATRDLNTAHIYARGKWTAPVAHLPAQTKPVVAVRFCPVIFRLDDAAAASPPPPPFDKLPYKLVFALATLDSVIIYETTSPLPLAVLGHLHYDSITDLAWSRDGQYLAVASRDCYCSIATFEAGELGTPALPEYLPQHVARRLAASASGPQLHKQPPTGAAIAAAEVALQSPPHPCPSPPTAAAAAAAAPAPMAAPTVRRIQPQPIGSTAAKQAKRIVPESLGPLSAVVGDSEAGVCPPADQPPSAKKAKKRITPELLPPAQPAAAPTTTAAHSPGSATPAGPTAKADASTSVASDGAASKGPKRITPTPLGGGARQRFEQAKQASSALPVTQGKEEATPAAAPRRITPVLVGPDVPLLQKAQPVPQVAPAAPKPPVLNIAAMAIAAGQQAALQASKQP